MRSQKAAVAASLIGALALAGCTAGTEESETSSVEVSQECAEKTQPVVDEARKPLESVFPTESLDMSALEGREIWIMHIVLNQWAGDVGKNIKEAAEAAGLKAKEWDGKGDVSVLNQGMAQAISEDAAAIVTIGLDTKLIANSLKDANAAGIPVLDLLSDDLSAPVAEGTEGRLTANFVQDGYDLGAWSALDSNCKASSLFLQSTTIPLWVAQGEGLQAAYEELCPDDCAAVIENVDLAKVATDLGPKVQTALTKDPDINYVVPAWDSAVTFATPAVQQVRPGAKILSKDGIPTSIESVRTGGAQAVDIINPPIPWISWTIVDQLGRLASGLPMTEDLYIPTRLIDETNVGKSDDEMWPEYLDYEDKYLTLWGKK